MGKIFWEIYFGRQEKVLVIVGKACLFKLLSAQRCLNCKLYTVIITINFVLYKCRNIIISMYTILLSGVRNGSSAFWLS